MGKGRKIPTITLIRMVVSLGLLVTATLIILTGIILYLNTTESLYRLVEWFPVALADDIHTYAGFVMAGLTIIHIYLNCGSKESYIKLIRSLA